MLRRAVLRATTLLVCFFVLLSVAAADTTSSISADFNGTAIAGGNTIWFSSVLKPSGLGSSAVTIFVRKSAITFTANGVNYSVPVADANITFDPNVSTATISFDTSKSLWQITAPSNGLAGNTLLDVGAFTVPAGGLPGGIKNVTWQANLSTDNAGVSIQWKWAAAVYTSFNSAYDNLGVKPVDDNNASQYQNSDHAGTPENYKAYVTGGATGGGGSNYTGGYSGSVGLSVPVVQAPASNPGGPYSAFVSKTLSLSGTGSSDPDGYQLNYNWNFGDGTNGTGGTPTHTYSSAGTFTVTLTVDDGRNVTGTASTTATLTLPPPPVITTSVTPVPNANGWNNSSVTVAFTCVDNNVGVKMCPSPVQVTTTGANQVVQGTATNNAGLTATATVKVNIDETLPTISASLSPSPDSSGWNNSNVTVSFSCSDSLSGIAQCPQPILVSSSGANQVVSGTATDLAGNTSSTSATLNVELTAPSIIASPSPAPNAQGWNNANVTVSFTCTQSNSPLTNCSSPQTITTEGAGQAVSGTVTDAANNSNTAQITLNIAKTPPTISTSVSPQPNSNGWNNAPVTVSFTCTKTTAPLATCPQSQTITTEGANQSVTGTATDVAGNSATATAQASIATTPPTITVSLSPQPNSAGWNNSAVTVTFTCTATTAPIANCPQPQNINTEGANQVISGTVTDVAGNTATAKVTLDIALTPPEITAVSSPVPNANGWNNSGVTVNFVCTNTTAPIASCPPSETISTQGAGQIVSGTVTDVAGNMATASLTLNIGTTPPTIVASVSPPPNAAGWNNSTVTVSFACSPGTAPITTCPAPVAVSTEGASQTVAATSTDAAGNAAAASAVLNIDLTPPSLSVASPANGATLSSSALTVSGSISDALSGVSAVSCDGGPASIQAGSFTCSLSLNVGANTITVQATDVAGNTATQSLNVTLTSGAPAITGFSPTSAQVGSLITVAGSGFNSGGTPQVTLNEQGGGSIPAPVSSFSANTLSFVIPTGAASGPITITVNGQSASSSTSLTIQAGSFSLAAAPSSAVLIPGQTTTYEVTLSSSDGFTQLAALSVSGLPTGVSGTFQPSEITAGQSSILTLSASAAQNTSSSQLTITAASNVAGVPESASATIGLNIQPSGGVAFAGRVAVTGDPYNTPIAGLTVRFTGTNYAGLQTGCNASTTTDSSGNFEFASLPDECSGAQLVQYDPSTITSPTGSFSGVSISYVLTPGQVTTPGITVHLPRVDNAETVMVTQNSSSDQIFTFKSIPKLAIVVYAGTTFMLADGTQPNPFPLRVVEIPYEDLPEQVQPDPTQVPVYAMSIEPFNSSSSQPVAVFYPNRSSTPPGTTMPLTSLNPVLGMMVNYGTGSVSADGTQIIPDRDPAHPGHAYGISHFDWFFFLPPPPSTDIPTSPQLPRPARGDPVDLASGVQIVTKTDIAFGGARGQVEVTRIYRTLSHYAGPFGLGFSDNYDYFIDFSDLVNGFASIKLITPEQNQFAFAQQADGTFVNSTIPFLAGTVISSPTPGIYTVRWKDGRIFQFQPSSLGPATGVSYLTSTADPNGNVTTLARNQKGQLTQITDPIGRTVTLNYSGGQQVASITDPFGRTVQYSYDPTCGALTTVTDVAGGVTKYGYDSNCRVLSITDARGITYLQNTYDQNGKVTKQVAGDGGVTTFAYTLLNPLVPTSPVVVTTVTDPLGNTTTYHFNPQGFMLDVTDPLGEKTVYNVLPGTNLLASVTDPLGRTTSYTYDSNGNTTSVTRLAGTSSAATTSFVYEPTLNKVASITDPLGHTTNFTYDRAGNLRTVIDSANDKTTFGYDGSGELTASTDPMGDTTQFSYSNGNLTRITDPLSRVTNRVSDGLGRLLVLTNPLGQSAIYQYDPLNDLTQITDPQGNRTSFAYDPNGNLLSVTDAKGNKTAYTYDSMDRLATRTDPLGHADSYQYDLGGNLAQFTDRRGIVSKHSYDSLNRTIQANFGGQETINYSYDAGSRLILATDSVTGTIARSYDGLDRLVSETTPQGNVSYSYDAAGRRTGMTVGGQQPVSYSYDTGNRLVQIAQGSSKVSFSYDSDGRRTTLTLPNGMTMTYSYDAGSQLTGISYGPLGNLTYTYDLAGRRTNVGGSFARTGMPNALTSASYNADNQVTQFGQSSLTYDANGNLTSDGVNTYTWSARNQLISISGGVAANFQYDAFGRRVSKTVGGTTQYLYDGVNPVEELSGTTVTASLLTGLGEDEYFQRTDASGPANFLTDFLGSTVALTGATGATVASYTYEPFGNTTVNGTSASPYQYTGRENDSTGLYFHRARYYSPTFQRFISEDPVAFLGGDANLYPYAFNSPLSYADPTGRCPFCVVAIAAGIGGGIAAVAEGIRAYRHGCSGTQVLKAAGRGFVAGAAGTVAGIAATVLGGANPVLGGAFGGAVYAGTKDFLGDNVSTGEAITDTALGGVTGGIADTLRPSVQGGSNFNPFTSPRIAGPRALQTYSETAISGASGAALGMGADAAQAALSGRKDANSCQ